MNDFSSQYFPAGIYAAHVVPPAEQQRCLQYLLDFKPKATTDEQALEQMKSFVRRYHDLCLLFDGLCVVEDPIVRERCKRDFFPIALDWAPRSEMELRLRAENWFNEWLKRQPTAAFRKLDEQCAWGTIFKAKKWYGQWVYKVRCNQCGGEFGSWEPNECINVADECPQCRSYIAPVSVRVETLIKNSAKVKELFDAHRGLVLRLIWKHVNLGHLKADQVEDMEQDCWAKIATNIGQYQDQGFKPTAWLGTVTENVIEDVRKKGFRRDQIAPMTSFDTITASKLFTADGVPAKPKAVPISPDEQIDTADPGRYDLGRITKGEQ